MDSMARQQCVHFFWEDASPALRHWARTQPSCNHFPPFNFPPLSAVDQKPDEESRKDGGDESVLPRG